MKKNNSHKDHQLIIFVKNPVIGKVKTRLAASVGYENAMKIYMHLLEKTRDVTKEMNIDKLVCYSDFIEHQDIFTSGNYSKALQYGNDVGQRMKNAINNSFENGYKEVVLIGSDIIGLTPEIINFAFDQLKNKDIVIGPAVDGGYYLIGMSASHSAIFESKLWSTSSVLKDTITDCDRLKLKTSLINTLSDFDTIENAKYLSDKDKLILQDQLISKSDPGYRELINKIAV